MYIFYRLYHAHLAYTVSWLSFLFTFHILFVFELIDLNEKNTQRLSAKTKVFFPLSSSHIHTNTLLLQSESLTYIVFTIFLFVCLNFHEASSVVDYMDYYYVCKNAN